MTTTALFTQKDSNLFFPTDMAYGPWIKNTQHGSAMMALIAYAAENFNQEYEQQVIRLTVDMMKSAPVADIEIQTKQTHLGKSTNTLDILMISAGKVYVKASALRCRISDSDVPHDLEPSTSLPTLPKPLDVELFSKNLAKDKGFHRAIDIRFDTESNPDTLWMKPLYPVVENTTLTGFTRLAMTSDWAYSTYTLGKRVRAARQNQEFQQTFFSINIDSAINIIRPSQGEWIGLQSRITYDNQGSGVANATLIDERGFCGYANQCLLIRPANKAPMHIRKKRSE